MLEVKRRSEFYFSESKLSSIEFKKKERNYSNEYEAKVLFNINANPN